jgi:uncharacterized protein (DUF1778 family)
MTRAATLELRVTPRQKELIRQAASSRGQTMTEFVIGTVEPVAAALVERDARITLSQQAWAQFLEMLDNPKPPPQETVEGAAAFLREHHPEAMVRNGS